MSSTPLHRVEVCSMQILDGGVGFAMDLAGADREAMRLEFPLWMLHQLMRALPYVDAALQQGENDIARSLVAYPVAQWSVEPAGFDGLAMCLRNDRNVEAGYYLSMDDALQFHRDLSSALERSGIVAAAGVPEQ